MADLERLGIAHNPGEAQFTLDMTVVPALTPETFKSDKATEEREFVEATISGIQSRKRIEQLEAHFKLELDTGGQ
jgi:hypothetical protein